MKNGKRYIGRKAENMVRKQQVFQLRTKHSTHVKEIKQDYFIYRLWRTIYTKEFGYYLQGATEDY